MMNRRWFFTATGSAFLTAACAVVQKSGDASNPPDCVPMNPPNEAPSSPDAQFGALMDSFFRGLDEQLGGMLAPDSGLTELQLPRDPGARRSRLEPLLEKIYRPRFDYRWEMNELPPECHTLRIHQACVLGQLTGLAFAYESGALGDPAAWSYEKPRKAPELDERHLQWARDTYGLYTNRVMKKRAKVTGKKRPIDLCGETGGPDGVQIDQPCAFCNA